ncbi:MAG: Na+/H+ antiporter subunit E [Roseinatronobacter sp.]|nr:Na+/H+ antiporter subunit E [Roseinatronobacter sp.]
MRATTPLRESAPARGHLPPRPDILAPHICADGPEPTDTNAVPALRPGPRRGRWHRLRRWLGAVLVLAVLLGMLTGWRAESLVFGLPAVVLGAMLPLLLPRVPGWRLSLRGALAFALWFAVQSVRGAVDVARRAFAPDMGLRPGFRPYPLTLPQGAPRVMFANTITLLPGTLCAEIEGDMLIVHMLDTRMALEPELAALEGRIRALFALPPNPELCQ